jgi:hypothetical protein
LTKLRQRKLLNIKYMPKRPKFKRGFTWHHHLDEWWDRRTQEWKVKLFLTMAGVIVALFVASALWLHHWSERDQMVQEAKLLRGVKIGETDRLMVAPGGASQAPVSLEVRSGE